MPARCVEGMLLNLAEAVDALRGRACPVERVLLIGGAAASTAVQAIAPDLFGVPVRVPVPGEYVALGAARQAAATLLGTDLPDWEVHTDAVLEPRSLITRGVSRPARTLRRPAQPAARLNWPEALPLTTFREACDESGGPRVPTRHRGPDRWGVGRRPPSLCG